MNGSDENSYLKQHHRKKQLIKAAAAAAYSPMQDPTALLTDRAAYMTYLESQLERLTVCCMTVDSYDSRLETVEAGSVGLEQKLTNVARLVKCSQMYTEQQEQLALKQNEAANERIEKLEETIASMREERKSGLDSGIMEVKFRTWCAQQERMQVSRLEEMEQNLLSKIEMAARLINPDPPKDLTQLAEKVAHLEGQSATKEELHKTMECLQTLEGMQTKMQADISSCKKYAKSIQMAISDEYNTHSLQSMQEEMSKEAKTREQQNELLRRGDTSCLEETTTKLPGLASSCRKKRVPHSKQTTSSANQSNEANSTQSVAHADDPQTMCYPQSTTLNQTSDFVFPLASTALTNAPGTEGWPMHPSGYNHSLVSSDKEALVADVSQMQSQLEEMQRFMQNMHQNIVAELSARFDHGIRAAQAAHGTENYQRLARQHEMLSNRMGEMQNEIRLARDMTGRLHILMDELTAQGILANSNNVDTTSGPSTGGCVRVSLREPPMASSCGHTQQFGHCRRDYVGRADDCTNNNLAQHSKPGNGAQSRTNRLQELYRELAALERE